jgi:thioredoxin-dependent peroxiredoxin
MHVSRILTVALSLILIAAFQSGCAQTPLQQRTGLVTMRGKPLTLVGSPVQVGMTAPAFTAVANDMSTYKFSPGGRVWILSAVPSVDTQVCSRETHHFNDAAEKLGDGISILTISMDLPFAQKRWCGTEGVKNIQTLSDFRDRSFGANYGVSIKESGLLARAVFVVGKNGKIVYTQLVPDLSHEPDYDAVIGAARQAVAESPAK